MQDTTRPWTAPGVTATERAQEVYDQNRRFNASLRQKLVIKEAIEAAVSEVLSDAAPKWTAIDDALPPTPGLYAVVGEDVDGEGFSFTERWQGNIKDWLNNQWQVTHYCGPLPDSPVAVARISGDDVAGVLQAMGGPDAPPEGAK